MLEREILINLTLEEGYSNYISFIESFKEKVEEDKDNLIGFLKLYLNQELLVDILKYNINTTLYSNKIIFNKYREEIPKVLGIDMEVLIKIPNIEDIAEYVIDNLEDFLEEEREDMDIYFNSYNIDLLIYNTISYYYKNPYKDSLNKAIENLRKLIIDYSNRIIESEEEIDRLYIDHKERSLEEKREYREEYYKNLGKLIHSKKRFLDRIKRLEERLKDLESIE